MRRSAMIFVLAIALFVFSIVIAFFGGLLWIPVWVSGLICHGISRLLQRKEKSKETLKE